MLVATLVLLSPATRAQQDKLEAQQNQNEALAERVAALEVSWQQQHGVPAGFGGGLPMGGLLAAGLLLGLGGVFFVRRHW